MAEKRELYYAFLDTNTFFHYRFFTVIDWLGELKAKKVILVFSTQVIRELDEKKFSAPNPKIRGRAKKVVSKLGSLSSKSEIRPNVEILFISNEPSINWKSENLDPSIGDDRIIAAILSQDLPKEQIAIITGDIGLTLKAKSRNLHCHKLSDNLALPFPRTSAEKEVIELKQRLSLLENKLPALSLKLKTQDDIKDILEVSLQHPSLPPLGDIESRLKEIRSRLEYRPSPQKYSGHNIPFFSNSPIESEIARYDNDLDEYIDHYRSFLEDDYKYQEMQSRILKLNCALVNEGTSPAEDIDVLLNFPDGFDLTSKKGFMPKPSPPSEPVPPRTQKEIISDSMRVFAKLPQITSDLPVPEFGPASYKQPTIRKTNSYEVSFCLPKLKHGFIFEFDPLHLLFPSVESAQSFNIDYFIHAANLPKETTGKVHIVINKESY